MWWTPGVGIRRVAGGQFNNHHVAQRPLTKDDGFMGRLLDLIDDYKDRHGQPSDASIARAIGITPAAVSAWRKRGIRELPAAETLRRLAAFIGVDESETFHAAGVDAGYLPDDLEADFESGRKAARKRKGA